MEEEIMEILWFLDMLNKISFSIMNSVFTIKEYVVFDIRWFYFKQNQ